MNSTTFREYARHADNMGRDIVAITEIDPQDCDHAAVAVLYHERYELWYLGASYDAGIASAPCEHRDVPDSYPYLDDAVKGMAAIVADLS